MPESLRRILDLSCIFLLVLQLPSAFIASSTLSLRETRARRSSPCSNGGEDDRAWMSQLVFNSYADSLSRTERNPCALVLAAIWRLNPKRSPEALRCPHRTLSRRCRALDTWRQTGELPQKTVAQRSSPFRDVALASESASAARTSFATLRVNVSCSFFSHSMCDQLCPSFTHAALHPRHHTASARLGLLSSAALAPHARQSRSVWRHVLQPSITAF